MIIDFQSAGDTALHIATLRNCHTVVKELVDLKAKFDLKINVENKVIITLCYGFVSPSFICACVHALTN